MAKLEPERLLKEELQYELAIRGVVNMEKVRDMVSALRGLLKLEREGKVFNNLWTGTITTECAICEAKIAELESQLGNKISDTFIRKNETKFSHIISRLERCRDPADQEAENRRITLYNQTIILYGTFLNSVSEFCHKQREAVTIPLEVALSESIVNRDLATSTPHASRLETDSDDFNPDEDVPIIHAELVAQIEKAGVRKWDVTFKGAPGESVNGFIERIEELAEARCVNKNILFHSAIEILQDKALLWYRANKANLRNWANLRDGLRNQFLPRNYNEQLWEQIKTRTQGDDESIGIYVAYMKNLFGRMTCPVSEEMRLSIMKRNVHPAYRSFLVTEEVKTEEQLIELGRRVEESQWVASEYSPPTKCKKGVEADLAYVGNGVKNLRVCEVTREKEYNKDSAHYRERKRNVSGEDDVGSGTRNRDTRGGTPGKQYTCFRCGRPGHMAKNCRTRLPVECFKCGKKGHVRSQCSGNGRGDR